MTSRSNTIFIAAALTFGVVIMPAFADGGNDLVTWKSLYELAIQSNFDGKEAESESYFEKALNEIRVQKEGSNQELMTLCRLTDICLRRRNSVKAENYFVRTKKLALKKKGDKTIDKESVAELEALSDAFLDYRPQNEDKRLRFLLNSLFLKKFVSGDSHPEIRSILIELHSLYRNRGDFVKAEPIVIQLVRFDQRYKGFESPEVATLLFTLGNIERTLKKYTEAESYYRQSLAIANSKEGMDPAFIPRVKCALAENLILTQDIELALKESQDALDRLVRDFGEGGKETIIARQILSDAQVKLGNTYEAVRQKEICVALINKYYGRNNPMNIEHLRYLYKHYKKTGNTRMIRKVGPEIKYIESIMKRKNSLKDS